LRKKALRLRIRRKAQAGQRHKSGKNRKAEGQ